ncbi:MULTISPECIES: DUF3987 domain-containing protein [Solidesulfovibrio]|uniref:DUF3987 domain-containing protein n=1 Tax=Solidesulfovibrio carbinolicus TaxID=296842 RepID=A0A4P6HI30_9BACT|nr:MULTISPECIES: DUF3987 domain-containing protein [Solidesulfovibrio]QAZ66803.1 hypothetical protein C3Y92_05920 [Solidesulfovibrio carbinolicus]
MAMKPRQDNFDDTPAPAPESVNVNNNPENLERIVRAGVENVKKGAKGDQNRTLNVTCYWIGRVLGEAALQDHVEKALCDAGVEIGINQQEAARTARSGLRGGAGAGAPGNEETLPQFLCEIDAPGNSEEDESLAIDDFVGKLPPMPLEVFPEKAREAIAAIAASKDVPQDMVGAFFLSLCAACIGRARTARYSKTWQEPGNLYFLVAAATGTGKSHTMKFIFSELARMEAIVKMQYREDRRKYEEDMVVFRKRSSGKEGSKGKKSDAPTCSANTGKKDEMPKRPPNIQYVLTDTTMEAAMDLLFDNPRGLCWLIDEFHNFIPGLDRYSAKGTSEGKRRLLSTWDGATICVNRKAKDGVSNELYIENATFSICGCVQPHLLPEIFTYDDLHQGLPERFLFVNCQPQPPAPDPRPEIPEWVEKYLTRITRVMMGFAMEEDQDGRLRGLAIDLDDAARKEWNAFSNTIKNKTYGLTIHGFAMKMRGITLRLALLLHCLRHADDGDVTDGEITFGDMTNAVALADYFFAQAQKMNTYIPDKKGNSRSATNDTHASRIAELLLKHVHEIGQLEGKIENKVLQGWFKKARLKINQNQLREAFTTLNIEAGREKSRRYRLITTDVLDICSKMSSQIKGVFEEDDFDAVEVDER